MFSAAFEITFFSHCQKEENVNNTWAEVQKQAEAHSTQHIRRSAVINPLLRLVGVRDQVCSSSDRKGCDHKILQGRSI